MGQNSSFFDDYYRLRGSQKKHLLPDLIFRHSIRYLLWYRLRGRGSWIGRVGCYRCSRKFGLEFSEASECGHGLLLSHPYNITVGVGVKLGDNVNLSKGCTLGNVRTGARAGSPKLGNCVFVGVNATVIGGVSIGDDVVIAPNAFVDFDVPAHSVVVGNPGTIHHKADATKDIILSRIGRSD